MISCFVTEISFNERDLGHAEAFYCVAPLSDHCAPSGLAGEQDMAHRGASSRPPGPVRTPAVREPMGDRAALERVVLELRGAGLRRVLHSPI